MSRREKIESMLAEDPSDTFLRYSLAMEFRSEGDQQSSLQRLDELINDDPPYVPAFFMSAQQLAELTRFDEARDMLQRGIQQANAQGDAHAAAEMSELLAALADADQL